MTEEQARYGTIREPGLYANVSNEEYHAGPGVSKSDLTLILQSPLHYKARDQRKTTGSMELGSAIHTAILEPHLFEKTYAVKPEGMSFTTKDGKAWRDAQNRTIITYADMLTIEGMRNAVMSHPLANDLLTEEGESELSCYWFDPVHKDILCKCRFDRFNRRRGGGVDLKSTMDARIQPFTKQSENLKYYMQASWYLYGMTQITRQIHDAFYFIAVEKEPPYGVMVYRASEFALHTGQIEMSRALEIYARCLESGEWPGYSDDLQELDRAVWIKRQEQQGII